jgi:hypothetical protein
MATNVAMVLAKPAKKPRDIADALAAADVNLARDPQTWRARVPEHPIDGGLDRRCGPRVEQGPISVVDMGQGAKVNVNVHNPILARRHTRAPVWRDALASPLDSRAMLSRGNILNNDAARRSRLVWSV